MHMKKPLTNQRLLNAVGGGGGDRTLCTSSNYAGLGIKTVKKLPFRWPRYGYMSLGG